MLGSDPTGAERQGRRRPGYGAEKRYHFRGRHDVDDRVDRPDLVERHVVFRYAVHFGFGLGQQAEDADRMLFRHLMKLRVGQHLPDARPRSVSVRPLVVIVVVLFVAKIMMVVVVVVMNSRGPRRFGRNQEPPARQRAVVVRYDAAGGSRPEIENRYGGLDGGPVIRKGVQHRGHEHVARPAPEGVQMNVQPRLRPDNLRRFTVSARPSGMTLSSTANWWPASASSRVFNSASDSCTIECTLALGNDSRWIIMSSTSRADGLFRALLLSTSCRRPSPSTIIGTPRLTVPMTVSQLDLRPTVSSIR